jgi:hypothetical protein
MYIFDSFPDRLSADCFASDARCCGPWHAQSMAFDERRDDVDPFPYQLTPPVVYVDRPADAEDGELEKVLTQLAEGRGGRFAGT